MTLEKREICPGCAVVNTARGEIMFGCPSEVLKLFIQSEQALPQIIVLPRYFYDHGVNLAALEFPLYYFLFVLQGYFRGKRLTVIGRPGQIERMRQILRLTLIGPTEDQMAYWGIEERLVEQSLKLSQYFALKKSGENAIAEIDDLIEFIPLKGKEHLADLGKLTIQSFEYRPNVFLVTDPEQNLEVNISIKGRMEPIIPIAVPAEFIPRPVFGVTALSRCTTGFDPSGYTTAFVLWLNGLGVSVDGVSWMKDHLYLHGISPREIVLHFVSHIHEDHSNIIDLIANGEKFHLLCDRLVFECLLEKAALTLNLDNRKVREFIIWHEAKPGAIFKWYGAEFDFWYTAHTIPTLGFRVSLNGRSVVFSGDTVWGDRLEALVAYDVVTAEFAARIKQALSEPADLIFQDAGGGLIHPDMAELAAVHPNQPIIPTHLSALLPELVGRFTLCESGRTWTIIPSDEALRSDLWRILQSPVIASLSELWQAVAINQGKIRQYGAGEVILNEGGSNNCFYVVIGGLVSARVAGQEVARLGSGDFFGEISLMDEGPCSAEIRVISPVKVLAIPEVIFREMAWGARLWERLEKIHHFRPVLMRVAAFKDLGPQLINRICEAAKEERFFPGEIIIKQGDQADRLFVISQGIATVSIAFNGDEPEEVARLSSGHILGEIGLLEGGRRTATVKAETEVSVLVLFEKEILAMIAETPALRLLLGRLAESRRRGK